MSYDKIKFAVGIFVITLFLAVFTFLYFLLEEKGTFDNRKSFYFVTRSANSFSIGMPLNFSGFNIGVIDKMSLQDDGKVMMKFSINEKNSKWISKGTYLTLTKPLIGSAQIDIHSTIGDTPLPDSSTLEIKITDDINGMISKLNPAVDKIINIINDIEKISSNISKKDSDLILTLRNIKNFTKKLSDNPLLTTITGDKNSTKNISLALNNIKSLIDDLNKITKNLNEDIVSPTSSTIKDLDLIMLDIKDKLKALDGTVRSIGESKNDIDEIKIQVNAGLQKSNQILDKVDSFIVDEDNANMELP